MAGRVIKRVSVAALVIGALECVFSLVIIVCSFVLAGKADMSGSLTPYWAGVPFLVPGILGLVVGISENFCVLVAFLVLNIIAFIIQSVGFILIAIVVRKWESYADSTCITQADGSCKCRTTTGRETTVYGLDNCDSIRDISVLLYVLLTYLVLASILALIGSIIGSIGARSENKYQRQKNIIFKQQQTLQQQYPQTQDNMYNQYPQTQDNSYPMG